VTFDEDEDEVDVYVLTDATAEPTETVTLTLDESEDFLPGSDSDTVFIRDGDTTKLYWTNEGGNNLWGDSANWRDEAGNHVAPTSSHDLYFSGGSTPYYSSAGCSNVAASMSTLYGLHIITDRQERKAMRVMCD
jgi:hypothetical protein